MYITEKNLIYVPHAAKGLLIVVTCGSMLRFMQEENSMYVQRVAKDLTKIVT
jgi:hypothetical protein